MDGDRSAPEVRAVALRNLIVSFAAVTASSEAAKARIDGSPLDDAAVLALAREAVERFNTEEDAVIFDKTTAMLFEDRRTELLAAVQYQGLFLDKIQAGHDPIALICSDVTLGG